MNRYWLAFAALGVLALSSPCAAQTGAQTQNPLVPLGVTADRGALTPMDYIEIQQLYARHSIALDLGDGAARGALFTPDGFYSNLPSGHKPRPRSELARDTTARGNVGERHVISTLIITPTKEGADGFAYLTMINSAGKVHSGFYTDKLVKTPEGWRFAARVGWYDVDPASPYIARKTAEAPAKPK
jgi:hypothetical protein